MAATSPQEVTGLLLAWSEGEQTAFEKLVPLVYAELRRVAHRYMAGNVLATPCKPRHWSMKPTFV